MKILMLSNMYPSFKKPEFGSFVKRFQEGMETNNVKVDKVVINSSSSKVIGKVFIYLKYFLSSWYSIIFKKYDILYVHYIAHSLIPVSMIRWMVRGKLVINVHGSDLLPESNIGKVLLKINKKTIQKADAVVVPSSYYRDKFH